MAYTALTATGVQFPSGVLRRIPVATPVVASGPPTATAMATPVPSAPPLAPMNCKAEDHQACAVGGARHLDRRVSSVSGGMMIYCGDK